MDKLNKWVDVRKKQIREAIDTNITIKKIEDLNCYFTVKEINKIDENNELICNYPSCRKIDKNYKMLEYTPVDENYNVRVFVNDKNEIFEYYIDITNGMELRDGVPYYNDLYLDVIYYNNKEIMRKVSDTKDQLRLVDTEELEDALNQELITKQQYDEAYNAANKIIGEIKSGTNIFVNRGLIDYLNLKN